MLRHLLCQPVEHFLCLPVDLGNVIVKGSVQEHRGVGRAPMLFEEAQIALAPDADGLALRQGQAREVVVAATLVPQAVALVKNVLVHSEILLYNMVITFGYLLVMALAASEIRGNTLATENRIAHI